MFRFTSIFPILLSIAAFILSLMVLIAGKDRNFMNDVFVLKIDASQIATNVSADSILSVVGLDASNSDLDYITNALSSSDVSRVLNTAAKELGLHDFYAAHVSTWCEGTLLSDNPNATTNSTDADQKVTNCTQPRYPFSFDPVTILEDELATGVTLADLGFPTDDINNVVDKLETAYKAMSMLYLIGCILAGISILTGAAGFMASRVLEMLNHIVALLAFLALGVASAIATAIAVKVKDVFNEKAAVINVFAKNSSRFLGMTWSAVVAMLLVSMLWCCVCCCGPHGRKQGRRRGSDDHEAPLYEKPTRRRFGFGWKPRTTS